MTTPYMTTFDFLIGLQAGLADVAKDCTDSVVKAYLLETVNSIGERCKEPDAIPMPPPEWRRDQAFKTFTYGLTELAATGPLPRHLATQTIAKIIAATEPEEPSSDANLPIASDASHHSG